MDNNTSEFSEQTVKIKMKFKLWLCFYLTAGIASAQDYFNLEAEYEGVYEPTFTQEELEQMKLPHSTSNDVDYDICKASKQLRITLLGGNASTICAFQ